MDAEEPAEDAAVVQPAEDETESVEQRRLYGVAEQRRKNGEAEQRRHLDAGSRVAARHGAEAEARRFSPLARDAREAARGSGARTREVGRARPGKIEWIRVRRGYFQSHM